MSIVSSHPDATTADPTIAGATIADELSRLTALYGSGLLDDAPQAALDALVGLTANLLACPTALITLVDRDTVHRRTTNVGPLASAERSLAMCDHAIGRPEGLVVADLAADSRFAASPSVAEGLRFYAGVPVHAPDAQGQPRAIGALCVVDTVARDFDEEARRALGQLATMADVLIAARADAQRPSF